MDWDVTRVELAGAHRLRVWFEDGTTGPIDFAPSFFRGVFARLGDPEQFAQVYVDHGAVAWPDNLDIAPDALHDMMRIEGRCALT